ncbi:MAG: xanthine dehydrogenase family protein molybdopterin-binding subunit [Anaerolineaceae bacterium]
MPEFKTITQPVARTDAWEKVTGKARYSDDFNLPGMLHMKIVLSARVHARILSLDVSEALRQDGVVTVLTAKDVPFNGIGMSLADQPVFCDTEVRYVGDRICAVVAETAEQAENAARYVKVVYEDLPIVSDPVEGLKDGAPQLFPDRPNNKAHTIRLRRGDADAALAAADVVVEREYRTPAQDHAYLEPEAGVGYIDEEGRVTVRAAGQWAYEDRRQIARALNLPEERVRVIFGAIGGAFGGREDISIQAILGLAAMKLQRPVKGCWTRTDSIRGHGKRHPMVIRHKWGAMRDGTLVAAKVEIISDCGAYLYTSDQVLNNYRFNSLSVYEIPNVSIDGVAVYTNNSPTCAFRGFGSGQATFAAELHIEHMAEALKIDPITLRLKNCMHQGSILPTQSVVPGTLDLPVLLVKAARKAGYTEKDGVWQAPAPVQTGPHTWRTVGLALAMKNSGFGLGFPEGAGARISLEGGKSIEKARVFIGSADVGQGSESLLAQIAAETLGIPLERVEMTTSDTGVTPDAGAASASRLTLMAGNAVKQACDEALIHWKNEERPVEVTVQYRAPRTTNPDPETGACECVVQFAYMAQAVEVEVDTQTGKTELVKLISVLDPGRAVNPQQVEGQIYGGGAQALGWALLENLVKKDGNILSDRFSTYLLPTSLDVPVDVDTELIENPDPVGAYGVRGIGEVTAQVAAPAIVSAVHAATGIWFDNIPILPESLKTRLQAKAG